MKMLLSNYGGYSIPADSCVPLERILFYNEQNILSLIQSEKYNLYFEFALAQTELHNI